MKKKYTKWNKGLFTIISVGLGMSGTIVSVFVGLPDELKLIIRIVSAIFFIIACALIINLLYGWVNNIRKRNKKIKEVYKNSVSLEDAFRRVEEKVDQNCELMQQHMKNESNFRFVTTDTTSELFRILDNNREITAIRIICYGRNAYQEVVQHINSKQLKINVQMIMCNPNENSDICNDSDKNMICSQIEEMLKYSCRPKIYVSTIPPTIRASTVYIDEKPIWSVTQAYTFRRENGKITYRVPERSVISVCDITRNKADMNDVVKCFDEEFKRLKSHSKKAILLNSQVIFVDREECW